MIRDSWTHKEYKHTGFTDSNSFKGVKVHIYDNNNGKYGFIELGKNYSLNDDTEVSPETLKSLWISCVETYLKSEIKPDYAMYKFTEDFINGMLVGLMYAIFKN